ncbi:hypothetical protein PMAYCL1PPCAC_31615, partial [Pristionchus mayeri]
RSEESMGCRMLFLPIPHMRVGNLEGNASVEIDWYLSDQVTRHMIGVHQFIVYPLVPSPCIAQRCGGSIRNY